MVKRIFDIFFSFFGLLILLPILLIIAILIVLETKGGVFYKQERVGKNKILFKIFKFRTMKVNSDKKGLLTLGDRDNRITRVGRFLRKTKLDELPQLINVLLGEMSFVGPRPEVKKYVDLYTYKQQEILKLKPGITDYASIIYMDEAVLLGKSNNPEKTYIEKIMPHKIELNKEYLNNKSVFKDVRIIMNTIIKIFR